MKTKDPIEIRSLLWNQKIWWKVNVIGTLQFFTQIWSTEITLGVQDVNFKTYPANQANLLGMKYDYNSIMHYGKQAFMDYTIDQWYNKVTIQTKDAS